MLLDSTEVSPPRTTWLYGSATWKGLIESSFPPLIYEKRIELKLQRKSRPVRQSIVSIYTLNDLGNDPLPTVGAVPYNAREPVQS